MCLWRVRQPPRPADEAGHSLTVHPKLPPSSFFAPLSTSFFLAILLSIKCSFLGSLLNASSLRRDIQIGRSNFSVPSPSIDDLDSSPFSLWDSRFDSRFNYNNEQCIATDVSRVSGNGFGIGAVFAATGNDLPFVTLHRLTPGIHLKGDSKQTRFV